MSLKSVIGCLASAAVAWLGLSAPCAARAPTAVDVILTTRSLDRALTPMPRIRFGGSHERRVRVIRVDDRVRYQRVTGFGAAMTDSSAWLLYTQLPPASRELMMRELFSAAGIHLGFIRVPIGASDFSATGQPYSYDDLAPGQSDPRLLRFSIAHDRAYITPALREVLQINPDVELIASPWSPPPWMKANHAFDNNFGLGTLLPGSFRPLAAYFVKFIQAYAAEGIPITAITPQNEPGAATPYPGMSLPAPVEARFIAAYLGPALAAAGLHTRIYGGDRAAILGYADLLLSGPAARWLSGIAWHCYDGLHNMDALHRLHPTVDQIVSECSPGIIPYSASALAISATRNWASAVALWNLALDDAGGPVQPKNYGCRGCTGLITVSRPAHTPKLTRAFFQLGQFSRFIRPGAVRIASDRFVHEYRLGPGNYGVSAGVDNVAFLNRDGTRTLVAYNSTRAAARFAVDWHGRSFTYRLPPGATVTFNWR